MFNIIKKNAEWWTVWKKFYMAPMKQFVALFSRIFFHAGCAVQFILRFPCRIFGLKYLDVGSIADLPGSGEPDVAFWECGMAGLISRLACCDSADLAHLWPRSCLNHQHVYLATTGWRHCAQLLSEVLGKCFQNNWPFVREIHWSQRASHAELWCFHCCWTKNPVASDLRCHDAPVTWLLLITPTTVLRFRPFILFILLNFRWNCLDSNGNEMVAPELCSCDNSCAVSAGTKLTNGLHEEQWQQTTISTRNN